MLAATTKQHTPETFDSGVELYFSFWKLDPKINLNIGDNNYFLSIVAEVSGY